MVVYSSLLLDVLGLDGDLRPAVMLNCSWHMGSLFAQCFMATVKMQSELVVPNPCGNKSNT